MPLPKPKDNESEKDYVARCIPVVKNDKPMMKHTQHVGICFNLYSQYKKKKKLREKLGSFKDSCK